MVVILQFKIEWGAIFSPDATKTKRAFDRILKGVNQAMAEYWHKYILPRHFKKGAQRRYGYQQRSKKHLQRKASRWGLSPDQWRAMENHPLVFTGALRDRVTRYAQVKAYPARFSVTMHGPYYSTATSKRGGAVAYRSYVAGKPKPKAQGGGGRVMMPDMAEEITLLLDSEQEELRQHAQKMLPSIVARESRRVQKKTVFFRG